MMRVLLAGWFSWTGMTTTAGDVLARDVAARWLSSGDVPFDVANAAVFGSGVDIDRVDPKAYSHLLFVCGPFRQNSIVTDLQSRFGHCRWIGLNLSMLTPLQEWNPFHVLFERDSSEAARADIVFASDTPLAPVAGVVLVHPQPQYGERARHEAAHDAIDDLWMRHHLARIDIDTCLESNSHHLRTPSEIEAAIARMDVVVTTRLHGMVLALKNGVPALVIDPIAGGAKIIQQATVLRWPAATIVDLATADVLDELLMFCLSNEGRREARLCGHRARQHVLKLQPELLHSIRSLKVS